MKQANKKIALITGVSGQDGAYLAKFLLEKDYIVHGTSRDSSIMDTSRLRKLGIDKSLMYHSVAINDFRSLIQCLSDVKPTEIYHLAAQSSVGLSFEQPVETMESIVFGTLNLLEAVRFINKDIKIYFASSSECYGNSTLINELSPFHPKSPYAVAKSASFWEVVNYRESYGLFACNGILFNHESSLRPERYVTKKIISTACRIYKGSKEKLILGNIDIHRDWGYAAEYVETMWLMLQQDIAEDYIVATGRTISLRDFCIIVFKYLNLELEEHLIIDKNLYRPSEILDMRVDTTKTENRLHWKARYMVEDVIKFMIEDELCEK